MAATDAPEPRTYGNWRKPGGGGLFGLGKAATYTGLAFTAFSLIVLLFVGPILGFVMLLVGLAMIAAASVPLAHGRTLMGTVTPRVAHGRDVATGQTRHRGGPLTRKASFALPGLAATTRLSEGTDTQGQRFAIVTVPKRHHHTLVFTADPDGAALVDQDDVDVWVARWGLWLASLGDEPGILAASVTVETSPDSGERLRRELDASTRPDAPHAARAMLEEIAESYPTGSAIVKAMAAITFRGVNGQYREDLERDLAGRVAHLANGLRGTGAGAARPMTAAELCEAIRCSYDPGAQKTFDDARATGDRCELGWQDVGPVHANAPYAHYEHDDARSVTWAMTRAPRGNVGSDVLARLLRPHPDIDRKRVTLLYRPMDSAKAARTVESDHRDAEATIRNTRRPTARMDAELRSAEQSAREEAEGAGLLNFGLIVTATVTDPDRLPEAERAVDQLTPTARIHVRRMYGSQEAAFTAGLPLGIVLPAHQTTTRIKEGL